VEDNQAVSHGSGPIITPSSPAEPPIAKFCVQLKIIVTVPYTAVRGTNYPVLKRFHASQFRTAPFQFVQRRSNPNRRRPVSCNAVPKQMRAIAFRTAPFEVGAAPFAPESSTSCFVQRPSNAIACQPDPYRAVPVRTAPFQFVQRRSSSCSAILGCVAPLEA
jgi:hypothetical protein